MLPLETSKLRRILCLGAHSDDIEIGCGGTLLRLLANNPEVEVTWVVLSASGPRAQEARESAGAFLSRATKKEIIVRDFQDSFFPRQWGEIKVFLHDLARSFDPDLIFTHRREDAHQDHRTLAELTWCAWRNHLVFEYEIPKYEGDLGRPNFYVPLDEEHCRTKVETTFRMFPSQHTHPWFTPDTFWSLLRIRGLECNSPSKYAEAFTSRKAVLSIE